MVAKDIHKFIEKIDQIPTLRIVSNQIMSVLSDENFSIKQVAELIEKDQALAVKILKVANSAFYGTLGKVSSIDHALVILGKEELKGILMAFSIRNFFSESGGDGFDRRRFWTHSVICSQVAKFLARHFNVQNDDGLFISGLIHDMGKVVLDQYFHEEFLQIIDFVSSKNESFSKAEKEILGITHYQVAAKLLQRWRFPEKVIMNVFYHHAPWHDKNYLTESVIVFLSNILTKMAGYPSLPLEKVLENSQFANSKAMDFLVQSGFDLDYETIQKMTLQIREFVSIEKGNVINFLD